MCCFNEVQCARLLMNKKWGQVLVCHAGELEWQWAFSRELLNLIVQCRNLPLSQTTIRGFVTGVNLMFWKLAVCLHMYKSHALWSLVQLQVHLFRLLYLSFLKRKHKTQDALFIYWHRNRWIRLDCSAAYNCS